MAREKQTKIVVPFNDRLILFRFFLRLFGKDTLSSFSGTLNHSDYEGLSESQNTFFFEYLDKQCFLHPDDVRIGRDQLRLYDENICRHVRHIGEKRGGLTLKYFQYIALLFTEIYLDRYFSDRNAFAEELNAFACEFALDVGADGASSRFAPDTMNRLAFMCATGSGKTLIMHINILQFLHYRDKAKSAGRRVDMGRIIVLSPNEGMSEQHLRELELSIIEAEFFSKEQGFLPASRDKVVVIDMNKFREEGKKKTVSVGSFESNNLVMVDEAHRGLSGDVWYEYRTKLFQDGGFAFEYSATFKQALKTSKASDKKQRAIVDEYMKSIIMDYSYKYFYTDGYGKDYRIYNLRESFDAEQKLLYLTGRLLSFYQQLKLYNSHFSQCAPFHVEKPLLVFVGNRVVASTNDGELTDVEEVLSFIDGFVRNREKTIERIESVFSRDTGLTDMRGNELFFGDFDPLRNEFAGHIQGLAIYEDILRLLFNTDSITETSRLHIIPLKQVDGEIGLKIGEHGAYFGVVNIGDTAKLVKLCERRSIVCKTEEFSSESLFRSINLPQSRVNILIGSRKFAEGWNSWRVSTMGLINFAKGEGSQAIQLFGRGVRLHGYAGCLKRSGMLDMAVDIPKYLYALETLTIFGVKAQYMEDFKQYLELEDMPTEKPKTYTLPVISRFDQTRGRNLRVIRLPEGVSFKKQAARLLLQVPDEGFMDYLIRNKTIIDCRSKVQTIQSDFNMALESTTAEHVIPESALRFLDYGRIFDELQRYKNEKTLYNISIDRNTLRDILAQDGRYGLIIPKAHIAFSSMDKLPLFTDFAIMALKSYIDKFYKYFREKWEAPRMRYHALGDDDTNFVDEYTFAYTPTSHTDNFADEIKKFVDGLQRVLNAEGGIDNYEYPMRGGIITAFDFRRHLYAPLISVKAGGLQISVSPVSLNAGEKHFVDMLRDYCENHAPELEDIGLYLLRNKSKSGMGFFEGSNFYPDYVLWLDMKDAQLVTFIDPKGLLRTEPDAPKVMFYEKIKELQERLQPSSPDKRVILNSFILSTTPSAQLGAWWDMSAQQRESRHVMCLDDPECVEKMMSILVDNTIK